MKRAKTYRGNSLREFGAIKADCWWFDAADIYADNESTTAFTKASLASDKLDEMDRSTAVESEEANNHEGILSRDNDQHASILLYNIHEHFTKYL